MGELIRHDLKFGLRYLRRRPGFAAVAIATLALAIGATTAVFSLVYGIVLQPLSLPAPDRLVMVFEDWQARGGVANEVTGHATFRDWREGAAGLAHLASSFNNDEERMALVISDGAEAVTGGRVSAGYFDVLGVDPARGREFRGDEEEAGADGVVVISHGLWQRAFGADSAVLGRTVRLDGVTRTIVGVLPGGFSDPLVPNGELWVPLSRDPGEDTRGDYSIRVVGRLRPDVTPERLEATLGAVTAGIAERHPDLYADVGVAVQPLHEVLVGPVREPSLALFGGVLLVLAIAAVNLANLLLARAAEREREMAVRTAVGARRRRLVRQLVTESLMLAALGGALSLPVGWGLLRVLVRLAPAGTPRLETVGLHLPVFLFAVVATVVVGLAFGLLPAWRASRGELAASLRQGARAFGGERGLRLRRGLIVGEVALSLALLVGAGLLVRTLLSLARVDPGFATEELLGAEVSFPVSRYPEVADARTGLDRVLGELRASPGVEAVTTTSYLPLTDYYTDAVFSVAGRPPQPAGDDSVLYLKVGTDYFRTLEMPLRAGRPFDERDTPEAARTVVVNESFAARYLGPDPVGQRIHLGRAADSPPWTVVGVAGDVRYGSLGETEATPLIYLSLSQVGFRDVQLILRTAGEPSRTVPLVESALRAVDPELSLLQVRTGEGILGNQTAMQRFLALLLASFAVVAVLLAAVGLYGVMAFLVAQRRREMGVRLALGARPRALLRAVVGQGLGLAAAGLAVGAALALALSRGLASLLYGVAPSDPWTLLVAGGVLLAAALAASLGPGLRAARVDPVDALRGE